MGKGKGKKSRKDDKKKDKKPKIKALSEKPPNPTKIANKLAAKQKREARIAELKEAMAKDPSLAKPFPTPMQRTEPFMKNPNAAKWPHLFKRQLGLIEMHIDSLTRIMNGMRNDGESMSERDRLDWELGERGNWRAICGMMDKARLVLSQTKEAAQGVLPPERLADKKKLGVVGTTFEPLVPKLDEKARELGYDPKGKGSLGRSMDYLDKDGDTEMSESSSSSDDSSSDSSDESEEEGEDFIKLEDGNKKKKKSKSSKKTVVEGPGPNSGLGGTESNQFFVVDTEPTPVDVKVPESSGVSNRQKKKEEKAIAAAARLEKRMAKKAAYEQEKAARAAGIANTAAAVDAKAPEPVVEHLEAPQTEIAQAGSPEVDFKDLEAKLQAEIADGTKAQEEAEAEAAKDAEKRSKKKRRRDSEGGDEVVEKKHKKDQIKEKKEKKEKKRKAEQDEAAEVDNGKKRKRKHKTEDSE